MPKSVVRKTQSIRQVLAAAVQQTRGRKGLSQGAVAVSAGTSPATIGEVESGKGNPRIETVERVCDVLGLEVEIRGAA